MIFVDYIDRAETTATLPTVCMHCAEPMCASVCPTSAISFGKYEQIVSLRRTKPVNAHVFGKQHVETKVYLMLPTDADKVKVDGCGVFEGRVAVDKKTQESWIDTQVEESDKSNEF